MDFDIDTKALLSSLRLIEKGTLLPTYQNEIKDDKTYHNRKKTGQVIRSKKRITGDNSERTSNNDHYERDEPPCVENDINGYTDRNDVEKKEFINSYHISQPIENEKNKNSQSKEDFLIIKPPPLLNIEESDYSQTSFTNIPQLFTNDDDEVSITDNRSSPEESYSNNKKSNSSNYDHSNDMSNKYSNNSDNNKGHMIIKNPKTSSPIGTKKYISNSMGKYTSTSNEEKNRISSDLLNDFNNTQLALLKKTKSVEKSLNDTIKLLPPFMIKDKFNPIKIKQRNESLFKVLSSYDIIRKDLLSINFMKWKKNDSKYKKKLLQVLIENNKIIEVQKISAGFIISNRIISYVIRLKYLEDLEKRQKGVHGCIGEENKDIMIKEEKEEMVRNYDIWKDGKIEISVIEFERTILMLQGRWKRYLSYEKKRKILSDILEDNAAMRIARAVRYNLYHRKMVRIRFVKLVKKHEICTLILQNIIRIYLAKKKVYRIKILSNRKKLQEKYDIEKNVVAFYYQQQGAAYAIQKWYLNLRWRKKKLYHMKYDKWEVKQPKIEEELINDDFTVQPLSSFPKFGDNFSRMGSFLSSSIMGQSMRSVNSIG